MMNNENRETVIVPEKKEKIERIKRKYDNMSMSDDTAKKIRKLEIINNLLVAATGAIGIATVFNYCVPDALPFVDEAIMTGITALFGSSSTLISNKIKDLAETGTTEMKMDEVAKLSEQMANVSRKLAEKKNGQLKTQ